MVGRVAAVMVVRMQGVAIVIFASMAAFPRQVDGRDRQPKPQQAYKRVR